MKKQYNTVIVILLVLAITLSSLLKMGNKFMSLREDVKMQEAQVEAVLQRRADLIPNLVATVNGYVKHEETVFFEIAEARSTLIKSLSSGNVSSISEASIALDSALGKLIAISENYPELKSSEQFIALMDELAGTENRIAVARQTYNEKVSIYNKAVQEFPTGTAARLLGYYPLPYFQADESAANVPTVNFN